MLSLLNAQRVGQLKTFLYYLLNSLHHMFIIKKTF